MEKDYSDGRMAHLTKAITRMIRNRDLENILILKEKCLRDIGKMVLEMEMESLPMKVDKYSRDGG